ncbi:hypothetical protein DFH09DRAFT_1098018 [Mycena vulgaris]|nr:hypothetical protein DFH09DRAFT_1098018 [Mycena vulgaris]
MAQIHIQLSLRSRNLKHPVKQSPAEFEVSQSQASSQTKVNKSRLQIKDYHSWHKFVNRLRRPELTQVTSSDLRWAKSSQVKSNSEPSHFTKSRLDFSSHGNTTCMSSPNSNSDFGSSDGQWKLSFGTNQYIQIHAVSALKKRSQSLHSEKLAEIGVNLPNAAIPSFASLISGRVADPHEVSGQASERGDSPPHSLVGTFLLITRVNLEEYQTLSIQGELEWKDRLRFV